MKSERSEEIRTRISQRIAVSRRIDYGTYKYFVWPYKGITSIDPEELSYMTQLMKRFVPKASDTLFTFQTDGEMLCIPLAMSMRKDLVVCRDYKYDMADPMVITQHTRYWTRNLYCDKPSSHRKVVIVEAIISTGATVVETVEQIRSCGAEVIGVVAALSKPEYDGESVIYNATGIRANVLMRVTDSGTGNLSLEWTV